ncbi:TIGR02677 family protein [Amphibacillus indicireducens]|uniref:TIGR02677 family protein n=1 Tax=Amphibacillus indicireducens TaxID=1076330 RepID=A0ABP7VBM6_9BACI
MGKVWPANYLVAGNVERYRKIMSTFYKRHRQMQGPLYRPEVLNLMQAEFDDNYGELEVDQDLESLVTWGNLQKQQEMIRPKSIEEYRNKNFRYQITEEGILVEEMVNQLMNTKHAARGALDEKGIRHLLTLLDAFVAEEHELAELWQEIREAFRRVGDDTANYIGYITSPDVDSRMKTAQFLVYKDKFVHYLRDFISSVQNLYHSFTVVIEKLSQIDRDKLIDQMHQKEQEVPMMDGVSRAEVEEQILGELTALKLWFIGTSDRPSEYDNLMLQTDQMITKITGLIYYFGQEIHQYQSRRKDYLHLAKWFNRAENLAEAHQMYGGIFGLDHSRHYFVSESSDATSNRQNSWELEPGTLFLSNRGRGARQERKARSFSLDHDKQRELLEVHQEQLTRHRQQIDHYFNDNVLDFSKVESLDSRSRQVFLKWISTAIATYASAHKLADDVITQMVATELDFTVDVSIHRHERIIVTCEDGNLEMPKVTMTRRLR